MRPMERDRIKASYPSLHGRDRQPLHTRRTRGRQGGHPVRTDTLNPVADIQGVVWLRIVNGAPRGVGVGKLHPETQWCHDAFDHVVDRLLTLKLDGPPPVRSADNVPYAYTCA